MKTQKEIETRVGEIDDRIDELTTRFNSNTPLLLKEQYKNKYERDALWIERKILHWVLGGKM